MKYIIVYMCLFFVGYVRILDLGLVEEVLEGEIIKGRVGIVGYMGKEINFRYLLDFFLYVYRWYDLKECIEFCFFFFSFRGSEEREIFI